MPRALRQTAVAGAATLALLTGCTPAGRPGATPAPSPSAPCGGAAASSARLGTPYPDREPAQFTTTGGQLFITAHWYSHDGVLDFGRRGATVFYIGPADTPPSYDPDRKLVTPQTARLEVHEGEYGTVDLPAGHYWLLTSNGGDVEIVNCAAGGVTGQPPPPLLFTPSPQAT